MNKIQVFDPALCCSTGVCGPEVDDSLVRFAADVEWLASLGAEVRRFNLSAEPGVFMSTAAVRSALQREGVGSLPLVLVDGEIRSRGTYPSRETLAEWAGVSAERQAVS